MGWLWGSGSDSNKDTLDPSLRDFLDSEAPRGPKPALPKKPTPKPAESSQPAQETTGEISADPAKPAVPPQSLFQDGRYAHLWKNYTPQNILDDRGKNEQDKLRDIVDAYNDRRGAIGRAAMENCAMEYIDQFNCFKSPTFWQASTVCRDESRKFNKCYDMQSKFLKALGYLTMDPRSEEDFEKIQMHADKLYTQMKEQEALIEKAREEGTEIPKFESVLSKRNVVRAVEGKSLSSRPLTEATTGATGATGVFAVPMDTTEQEDDADVWSHIKPTARQQYEKNLAKLPPEEQEIERRALMGELRANTGMAKQLEGTFIEERINRMKRREKGQATIGDTIKRLWGWD